jgi:hypothetical protein
MDIKILGYTIKIGFFIMQQYGLTHIMEPFYSIIFDVKNKDERL